MSSRFRALALFMPPQLGHKAAWRHRRVQNKYDVSRKNGPRTLRKMCTFPPKELFRAYIRGSAFRFGTEGPSSESQS